MATAIAIKNMTKRFRSRLAVDRLTFDVAQGEVFGFLGPNGAGKSTTIRAMLALIRADEGDIELFGQSVTQRQHVALRRVGAMVEKPDFYKHLSARQNLRLLARMGQVPFGRVEEVLGLVGLMNRAGDRVRTYSQGMKQRLGLAQALLGTPALLVLDEPTNGLDPHGTKEVRDLIRSLAADGVTIFLSSHLLHEMEQVCTSMAVIDRGRLVTTGRVRDLLGAQRDVMVEIEAEPADRATVIARSYGQEVFRTADGRVSVTMAAERVGELNARLVSENVRVSALVPKRTLEDYFLSQTKEGAVT